MITVGDTRYEHEAEAEAGIYLSTGVRWWGSRIRYRRLGIADKRWTKFVLADVHPFDAQTIADAVRAHIAGAHRG